MPVLHQQVPEKGRASLKSASGHKLASPGVSSAPHHSLLLPSNEVMCKWSPHALLFY